MAFSIVNPLLCIGSSVELQKDLHFCKRHFVSNNMVPGEAVSIDGATVTNRSEIYAIQMTTDRRISNLNSN